MKWFKHHYDAKKAPFNRELLRAEGVEAYGHYMLLLGVLCEKFTGKDEKLSVHLDDLLEGLEIKQKTKLDNFLKKLNKVSAKTLEKVGRVSVNFLESSENFYFFEAPILFDLKDRDFKAATKKRGQSAPKNKEIEIEKEVEIKEQKAPPLIDPIIIPDNKLKPERLVELFNSKLAGVGNIKASPNFFLPSGLIEDFQKITGFPEFQKLETWEKYFNLVASSEYFTKTWTPSLAWLLDPDNAFKVLSGQYQDGDKKEKPSEKIPEHLVASASAWAYRAYSEFKSNGEWYGDTDFDIDVLSAFGDVSEIRDSIPQTRNEIVQKLREAYYKASSGISKTA